MKHLLFFSLVLIFSTSEYSYCQNDNSGQERNWQIEIEPSTFFLKGFGLQIGRYFTESKQLSVGLYTVATNVPEALKTNIFSNTVVEDNARVGLQVALNTRYKFNIFKERESNPYIGLITGWEYFNLTNPVKEDLRVDVILLTPYIGAEIYYFKNILYVNPQLRAVTYLNPKFSIANRAETLNSFLLLPQISLGVRF